MNISFTFTPDELKLVHRALTFGIIHTADEHESEAMSRLQGRVGFHQPIENVRAVKADKQVEVIEWMAKKGYDRKAAQEVAPIVVDYLIDKKMV